MSTEGIRASIEHHAQGMFRPHGRIELHREGRIVLLEAQGPFNTEAILAVGAAWRSLFADVPPGGAFGDIVIMHGSVMAGPEVLTMFRAFLDQNTALGLAPMAVAWVVPETVEGWQIMMPRYAEINRAAGRNFEWFDNLPAARAWVAGQLDGLAAAT